MRLKNKILMAVCAARRGGMEVLMEIKPYNRTVNYYEIDQMGIVHHSHYIRFFEEARVDLMYQIGFGYDKAVRQGIDFAVLSLNCEYKSMVCFADTLEIAVSIKELETMKMTIEYKITDSVTGELRATGKTEHCYYDREKKRPTSLKKAVPELYESLAALL